MVNVWCVGALLLVLAASNVDAAVCPTTTDTIDTCPATEVSSQESRPLKAAAISISEQSSIISQLVDEEKQAADNLNATPFISRPATLTEQQQLIRDVIEHTRTDASRVFVPSTPDPRWKIPLLANMNGEEVLIQYGLQPVSTPSTGNCQYYAVAMSLLNMRFDTQQHIEVLEQITQRLKEGIKEASRHGYEVEFPHDIRQTNLVSTQLDVDPGQELTIPKTEGDSNLLFREYIYAIAHSPSTISAYLPMELWVQRLRFA